MKAQGTSAKVFVDWSSVQHKHQSITMMGENFQTYHETHDLETNPDDKE